MEKVSLDLKMPGPDRRARLRRSSTIEIDHFRPEDDELKFKVPTFQPLSSRYKKLEEKMRKEEELRELRKLRKPKKRYSEEEEDNIEEEKERQKMKAQLEKVLELRFYCDFKIIGHDFSF